ncbi:MAG: ABC transporter permease [Eubacteriales bacterium]
MRLLIPELKKLFTIKLLLWMMAALLTANGLLAWWHSLSVEKEVGYDGRTVSKVVELYAADPEGIQAYVDELTEYRKAQSILKAQAKEEGREFVETRRALYSDGLYTEDLELIDIAKSLISSASNFPKEIRQYIKNTEINRTEYLYRGYDETTIVYRYQQLAGERYTEVLNNVTLRGTYTGGWNNFFTYTMGGVFVAVAAILIGAVVFINERETGMFMLLRPSRNGRFRTGFAKVIAALIAAAVAAILITLESLAIFALRDGLSGAFEPIQAVSAFRASTFLLDVAEYAVIFTLFKVAGAMTFAAVAMLVSVIVSKYIVVFSIGAGFFGLNFIAYLTGSDIFQTPLRYLNLFIPFEGVRPMARYSAIVFLGEVCECLYLVAPTTLSFALIACVMVLPLYCRQTLGHKKIKVVGAIGVKISDAIKAAINFIVGLINRIPMSYSVSGRGVEVYKTLYGGILAIIFVLAAVLSLGSVKAESEKVFVMTYDEQVCQYYRSGFDGEWTPEKHAAIEAKYYEALKANADFTAAQIAYSEKKITDDEFAVYRNAYFDIGRHAVGINLLLDQSNRLKTMYEEEGIVGVFVEDLGWKAVLTRGVNFFTFAVIILVCVGVYAREYAGRPVADIIRATKKGRGFVWRSKTATVVALSALLTATCEAIDILYISKQYALDLASYPARSLKAFASVPSGITLGEYLALSVGIRIFAGIALALFVTALSSFLKKQLAVISTACAITLLPAVAEYIGVDAAEKFNFLSFYGADRLISASFADGGIRSAVTALLAIAIAIGALTLISAIRWCGEKRR